MRPYIDDLRHGTFPDVIGVHQSAHRTDESLFALPRIRVTFASACPDAALFRTIANGLKAAPT